MRDLLLPALYALFIWWFSTGAIMYLNGLGRATFRWSMLGATAVLVAALYGLAQSGNDVTPRGAYVAFTAGLLVFGWLEASFYLGYVTGPRRGGSSEGASGWQRFREGVEALLYHELALIAAAVLLAAVFWDAANQIGVWTFLVLWWMQQSAKLNLFLGVRNLNEEFLPDHMRYLSGYFRQKPMNLLFPLSVTVSTVVAWMLFQSALAAEPGSFERTGFVFLATLMALAVLEHWFLVLPLPAAALWNWSLWSRATRPLPDPVRPVALGRRP